MIIVNLIDHLQWYVTEKTWQPNYLHKSVDSILRGEDDKDISIG